MFIKFSKSSAFMKLMCLTISLPPKKKLTEKIASLKVMELNQNIRLARVSLLPKLQPRRKYHEQQAFPNIYACTSKPM